MARHIAIALILVGFALGFRGLSVWTGCGYDCPALRYPNLTATGAILAALMATVIGLGVFIASLLGGPSKRG
jgi:hypothetical protein